MRELLEVGLYTETLSKDSVGQTIKSSSVVKIMAVRESISQTEFFKAEEAGLRPEFKLIVYSGDYAGQTRLNIDNDDFTVYRTYKPCRDKIELYVGERVGSTYVEEEES